MLPNRSGIFVCLALWLGCHVIAGLDDLEGGEEPKTAAASVTSGSQGSGAAGGAGSGASAGAPMSSVGSGGVGGGATTCCGALPGMGCPQDPDCETCVCGCDSSCCLSGWSLTCGLIAQGNCAPDCNCMPAVVQPCTT